MLPTAKKKKKQQIPPMELDRYGEWWGHYANLWGLRQQPLLIGS